MRKNVFVYDLMAFLKKNPKRYKAVRAKIAQVRQLDNHHKSGGNVYTELQAAMSELVKLCGYNMGLLIPFIFPTFVDKNPMSLVDRPFMFSLLSPAPKTTITQRAGRQVGKCLRSNTKICTKEHGTIAVQDIFCLGTVVS